VDDRYFEEHKFKNQRRNTILKSAQSLRIENRESTTPCTQRRRKEEAYSKRNLRRGVNQKGIRLHYFYKGVHQSGQARGRGVSPFRTRGGESGLSLKNKRGYEKIYIKKERDRKSKGTGKLRTNRRTIL